MLFSFMKGTGVCLPVLQTHLPESFHEGLPGMTEKKENQWLPGGCGNNDFWYLQMQFHPLCISQGCQSDLKEY